MNIRRRLMIQGTVWCASLILASVAYDRGRVGNATFGSILATAVVAAIFALWSAVLDHEAEQKGRPS